MKIETFELCMEYEEQRDGLTVHILHTVFGISRVAIKTYVDYFENSDKYRFVTYDIRSEGIRK